MLELKVSKNVQKRIDVCANRLGITTEVFIRETLLEKLDDLADELAAKHALADDDGTRISLDEVKAKLKARQHAAQVTTYVDA